MTDLAFEAETPLGFMVRCTRTHWAFIATQKHPSMSGHEGDVRQVLWTRSR